LAQSENERGDRKVDRKVRIFWDKEGRGYIHIADVGDDRVTLVTPYNIIDNFDRNRFDGPVEGDEHDFLSSGDVTREQVGLYRKKMLWMKTDAEKMEKRKARREAQEALEGMTNKQRKIVFSTALNRASPSVLEEVKLILGVDL
jgi:hypothetical protein